MHVVGAVISLIGENIFKIVLYRRPLALELPSITTKISDSNVLSVGVDFFHVKKQFLDLISVENRFPYSKTRKRYDKIAAPQAISLLSEFSPAPSLAYWPPS